MDPKKPDRDYDRPVKVPDTKPQPEPQPAIPDEPKPAVPQPNDWTAER